jgi:PmbA protein
MSASVMDKAVDAVLEIAQSKGYQLEVLGAEKLSTAISYQGRKLEQFQFSETRQLGVRLIDGQHEGVAYTESLDPDSLESVVSEARENARMIKREWISELHSASSLPDLKGIYNPLLEDVAVEKKLDAAAGLESAALDYDTRITNVAYARYGDTRMQSWIANTRGLRGSYRLNACYAYAHCLAKDGDAGVMAGDFELHRGFDKLDTKRIAETAARKTLERLGADRPATGKYTIVFENRVAEDLVGMIAGYFSGKSVDDKTSPLAGKLGQKIFSEQITLTDDPHFIEGQGSRPFDDEGYATQKTALIENGRVNAFLTNSVLARKLKLAHTASAARAPSTDLDVTMSNLLVKPGTHTLESLLNADSKVILITDIMGKAGFRAASGDFSLPVEGQLYENGKRVAPLKDFLISGNILQLFSAVEAVGQDVMLPTGHTVSPSLLVRGLNVAGKQG